MRNFQYICLRIRGNGMANQSGRCVICGEGPTVKAHIFPRALIFDIRGDAKNVIEGDRSFLGTRKKQSGDWDDGILCDRHEKVIGGADEYATDFIRREPLFQSTVGSVRCQSHRNAIPDKLLHFAYSAVWRRVVSRGGVRHKLNLGPYDKVILDAMLKGGPYALPLIIGKSGLGLMETGRLKMAIDPYRQRLGKWNCWHFNLCGFDFHLVTDQRPLPSEWTPYIANRNDPLIVTDMDFLDIRTVPMLRSVLNNMIQRPGRS